MKSRLILPAAVLLACSAAANANIAVFLGNNPQPGGEQNVLLNTGMTGLSVFGITNQTGTLVNFSSTELLALPSSGQARVTRDIAGEALTNLSISIPGGVYGDLIFNPFLGSCTACTPGGTATVTVTPTGEAPVSFDYLLGNGNNFVTIVATNGETISSTTINAPGGFGDLRQTRISGVAAAVPEPTDLPIAAAGMFLLAVIKKIRG